MPKTHRQIVGEYIYNRLPPEAFSGFRDWMDRAKDRSDDDGQDMDQEAVDLANAGQCVSGEPPYDDDAVRGMLVSLAEARLTVVSLDDWLSLLGAAFPDHLDLARRLYEEVSGADVFTFSKEMRS